MIAPRLVHVVWELTLRCDLACGHCGSRAGKTRANELTTDEALDLVGQLAALGAREVSLIGGEAYLREDWTRIARAIADAGMSCSMVSGGRGFTAERAREAFAAGISNVSISIDGLGPTHDRLRGLNGSFDAAIASLAHLRAAGVTVSANTQLNRLSSPELEPLLDLLLAHGVGAWQVAMTVPMGRANEHDDWLLQPYELLELFPRLAAVATRAADAGLRLEAGNNVGYFGPHEQVLRAPVDDRHYYTGCTAGVHALGIEADGTIKGCPSLPTKAYAGGSIRERSLAAIWSDAALSFRRNPEPNVWGPCGDCYYANECQGGCSWTAHVFFGRRGNNPYCHHRALEHAARGLRERLVRVEAAPGLPFDHGRFTSVIEPAETADIRRRALPLLQ